jgi:hypothetical protein
VADDKKSSTIDGFDEKNAEVLSKMLIDRQTSEAIRLQIINELNESTKNDTFFESMFAEMLSFGACPCCHHENHWLVPEDDLNQMGWISYEKDDRVKRHTSQIDCPEFAEACTKKRVTA